MSDATNYAENQLIDTLFRGGSGNWYVGLLTAITAAETGAVTEVASAGGYARVAIPKTTDAWAGTQGAGTTGASSGTSGQTSNNAAITFPAPTTDWAPASAPLVGLGLWDAPAGGNLWFVHQLTNSSGTVVSRTVLAGDDPPFFAPSALTMTLA